MANSIAHPQQPHFAPSVDTGALVFVSGQFGFDERGVITGDVSEQTRQCLRNAERILQTSALSRSDIVKATVWLRREQDFVAFDAAYAAWFGSHRPARSTVICALARQEALVEIEVIAGRSAA